MKFRSYIATFFLCGASAQAAEFPQLRGLGTEALNGTAHRNLPDNAARSLTDQTSTNSDYHGIDRSLQSPAYSCLYTLAGDTYCVERTSTKYHFPKWMGPEEVGSPARADECYGDEKLIPMSCQSRNSCHAYENDYTHTSSNFGMGKTYGVYKIDDDCAFFASTISKAPFTFSIRNMKEDKDKCAEPENGNTAPGTWVQTKTCDGSDGQNWVIRSKNANEGLIRSSLDSAFCLSATNSPSNQYEHVVMSQCNKQDDRQIWLYDKSSFGYLKLASSVTSVKYVSMGSNEYLGMTSYYDAGDHLKWRVEKKNIFVIQNNDNNGCMEPEDGSTAFGTWTQVKQCDGSDKQNWIFGSTDSNEGLIRAALNSNICLSATSSPSTQYEHVMLSQCDKQDNRQIWLYGEAAAGYVKLASSENSIKYMYMGRNEDAHVRMTSYYNAGDHVKWGSGTNSFCASGIIFDALERAELSAQDALSLEDSSNSLFQLPGDSNVGSNIIDFLITELTDEMSQGNAILLPTVVRVDDGETVDGVGSSIGACGNLDVVAVDSIAFGFETSGGKGLCVAFNPCAHLIAISQTGILPGFKIAGLITVNLSTVAISLERGGLEHTSVNKMWNGLAVAEKLTVPGHLYIAGTASMGVKISDAISATFYLTAELIIDADPNENGIFGFQPLGESTSDSTTVGAKEVSVQGDSAPSFDFAFLASGTQSAELTLKTSFKDFTVDLGGLIQTKKDLYVRVDDSFVEMQYASGVSIDLEGLCDVSDAFDPICLLFAGSFEGRVNAYFNTDGDFGLMLAVEASISVDISGDSEEVEELMEDIFGGDINVKGSAEISMDFNDGALELCLNLNDGAFNECLSFCDSDSDCASDKFCNPLMGMCRPKRNNNFWPCIQDTQCNSGRCVDTTRFCKAKVTNGDACLTSKECVSGHCSNLICGKPCSSGCSSSEWCNDNYSPDFCRPKRDNNYWPCDSDAQCKSGRCVDTSRYCKSKLGKGDICYGADKACKSGDCSCGFLGGYCC